MTARIATVMQDDGRLGDLPAGDAVKSVVMIHTTTLLYNSSATVACLTLPANAIVHKVEVVVDAAFNSVQSASVGISGTVAKYMPTDAFGPLTEIATYVYHPGLVADGGTNAIIITYTAGSPSVGSARVLIYYSIP